MATQSRRLLLAFSILLGLLAISATARPGRHFHPCRNLILFSTTTTSSFPLLQNPSFSAGNPNFRRQSVTVFITEVRDIDSYPSIVVDRATVDEEKQRLPLGLYSSSFRDRTKDILSVVGSLLFGVGCGALTAATLYLMWSLFGPNRFEFRDSDDEFDGDEDEDEFYDASPKKMGYVTIPSADSTPVVAKEVAKEVV